MEADVLVVGGGIAGMFAAIKAKEQGADVLLVNKGYTAKAGLSPFATGFIAFNPKQGDNLEVAMNHINQVSEYLNNRYWTERVLKESYARYEDMVSWGVEFNKPGSDDVLVEPPAVGMTPSAHLSFAYAARNNVPFTKTHQYKLRKQALKIGVKIQDRIMVTELLKQNGRIVGAVGIPYDSFDLYTFMAKTTILCVGPCSFKPYGYPPLVNLTCDGEAMAYRAGAEILGKEFVDTHQTLAASPSIMARRGLTPELVAFLNQNKTLKGKGPTAPVVSNAEDNKLPARAEGVTDYIGTTLDGVFEAWAGRAPVYNTVGAELSGGACLGMSLRKADGLWPAGTDCGTSLPGLYAAGDTLGTMQNGAVYYLKGGSMAGCAVTGAIAGEAAAKEALKTVKPVIDAAEMARIKQIVHAPVSRKGGYRPSWTTQLLQNTMMPYFITFIKKAERLEATLTLLGFMQDHLVPMLFATDPHELRLSHEARNMILSAEMRMRSALFRTESRGNHYREEYPRRDDENWLAWSKIKPVNGKMTHIKVPVPKEWRPDTSTPYRQRYPFPFPGE